MSGPRFEDGFAILHCGRVPVRIGNMSLRGPATFTSVAYRCASDRCRQEFLLVDQHNLNDPASQAVVNELHDSEE